MILAMHGDATGQERRTQPARTRGIVAAAALLGVHQTTLWRAIRGRTNSPQLVARYADLIRHRTKTTPSTPKLPC